MGEAAAKALAIDPDLVIAQALYQSGNLESWSLLGEIEAFEWAVRKQPNDPMILDVMSWDLLSAGYLQEAVNLSERRVIIEPLSLGANMALGYALFAAGRSVEEAGAAMQIADQLGHEDVKAQIGDMYLIEKQDDMAIPHIEAFLQQQNIADIFRFKELVTAARDPATGQAFLDRRIPEIVASMGEEEALQHQIELSEIYLLLGFLDRYYEIIFDLDPIDSSWSDVDLLLYNGIVSRRGGFTAHPKYLEVAEMVGMIDVWEQRGPPDFCEKVGGQWVCE
jgi:tetratricopeptide (TPR) repeat protein